MVPTSVGGITALCSRRPALVTDSLATAVSVSLDSKLVPRMYAFGEYTNHDFTSRWAGNAVLTYFLGAVLDTAGYHKSVEQANINLGYSCFQFVFALTGSAFVDKFGRRRLMLTGMAGCAVVWVGMTTASALFKETGNMSAAKATVAMIFMFGAVFSFCITPLQALYPVEVLSFEMRAKGMAFSSLAVNAGGLLNQFAWPVSLANIGWKTYIIFILWCTAQTAIIWWFFPETKNRTVSFSKFEASRYFLTRFSLRNSTTSSKPPIQSRSRWRRRQSWLASNMVLLLSKRLWLRCILEISLNEDSGGWILDPKTCGRIY
jgi:MFS family permease